MEQPPGSLDDLQPQDLSTSSSTTVIDLTRRGEGCVLDTTSVDALHRAKNWYPNSGASDPGIPFSDTSSLGISLQSGDQIQPDNALSNTTVTLSYVSRSHVVSANDSLSCHSPRYSAPPISKRSLHPPGDTDKRLGDSCYSLNQHHTDQADETVDLVPQTELFQLLSQAQMGPEHDGGACPRQEPPEVNGRVISSDRDMDNNCEGEGGHSLSLENGNVLENGQGESWSCSGLPETLTPTTGDRDDSEVHFVMAKNKDAVVILNSLGTRDLCSLSREFISPLEDPVSPSTTSQDDVEDVFILPQASSSPSGDNSYLETADEVVWNVPSNTEGDIQPTSGITDCTTKVDSSDKPKQPVSRRKAVLAPLIDLTDDGCVSNISENETKTVIPHLNGNTKALQRTLREKKLPLRSGRGTRLESIVMNINSSRYKVSGCIRTNKKTSQSKASVSKLSSPKKSDSISAGQKKSRVKASFSVKTKQKAASPTKRGKTNNINTDICKDSTSDSELNHTKKSHSSTPPKSPRSAVNKNLKKSVKTPSPSQPPPPQSPKKSPGKAKARASGSKPSPTAKTKGARTPRKRRKKQNPIPSSSSMFAPKEPEIKLRYVNYKEEKRDSRLDAFSPFIRVERQQSSPSLCTVINYPEEVRTPQKKGQQQAHPSGFISAIIPSTSCLQLGRPSTHSQHQRSLVCCLCGRSANAMDLGDLHGPYYPDGYRPSTKTPACTSGIKEEGDGFSDSDSSSCSIRGRGRKGAVSPRPRPLRLGSQQEGNHWRTSSPAAKRARSDTGSADVEDWYSPPVLPLEPCEYWLHEDCGIWSAGVFLVKGKVYGLEEAVKMAQDTACSACQERGATLGCFFKGCPNKYHYRCALESDCVLIEENFSMKCKKHKNKTFKAPPGNRWDDR